VANRSKPYEKVVVGKNLQYVIEALRASGMGHYVYETFSVQSLSAHVRELERQHTAELADGRVADTAHLLPSALASVLEVKPAFSVQGRRSS
jgi:hypothetical protein